MWFSLFSESVAIDRNAPKQPAHKTRGVYGYVFDDAAASEFKVLIDWEFHRLESTKKMAAWDLVFGYAG
jgi:hypothetical protein